MDIFPDFIVKDIKNSHLRNSEFLCKESLRIGTLSYELDLFYGEFRERMGNAFSSSAFIRGIDHVFFLRSSPQMVWMDTQRIIRKWTAIVTGLFSFWKFTFMKFIGEAMSWHFVELPITSYNTACPNPAMVGFIYKFPESFGRTFGTIFSHWKLILSDAIPRTLIAWRGISLGIIS